jgi:hypothetical protein
MKSVPTQCLIIVIAVVLTACASSSSPRHPTATEPAMAASPQPPSSTTSPVATPLPFQLNEVPTPELPLTTTVHIEPGLQPLIEIAIADLANRLSIERASIEVTSAQSVVWPDRSLGCPQPGMVYPQVLAEGFYIELRVKDQAYAYHGGEGRGPFLCEHPAK